MIKSLKIEANNKYFEFTPLEAKIIYYNLCEIYQKEVEREIIIINEQDIEKLITSQKFNLTKKQLERLKNWHNN